MIFSANRSFLFRKSIIEVSVNHLLLQIESKSFILSIIRFYKKHKNLSNSLKMKFNGLVNQLWYSWTWRRFNGLNFEQKSYTLGAVDKYSSTICNPAGIKRTPLQYKRNRSKRYCSGVNLDPTGGPIIVDGFFSIVSGLNVFYLNGTVHHVPFTTFQLQGAWM